MFFVQRSCQSMGPERSDPVLAHIPLQNIFLLWPNRDNGWHVSLLRMACTLNVLLTLNYRIPIATVNMHHGVSTASNVLLGWMPFIQFNISIIFIHSRSVAFTDRVSPMYVSRYSTLSITDLVLPWRPSHSDGIHAIAARNAVHKVSLVNSWCLLVSMMNPHYLTTAIYIHKVPTPPISITSWLATGTSYILTQKQAHPHLLAHWQVLCPQEPGCLQYVLYKFHPHLFCILILFPVYQGTISGQPTEKALGSAQETLLQSSADATDNQNKMSNMQHNERYGSTFAIPNYNTSTMRTNSFPPPTSSGKLKMS